MFSEAKKKLFSFFDVKDREIVKFTKFNAKFNFREEFAFESSALPNEFVNC